MSGIHGSFKNTCEITVRVMRANRESLLAVMEGESPCPLAAQYTDTASQAFVYDPLISWRLVQPDGEGHEGIAETLCIDH